MPASIDRRALAFAPFEGSSRAPAYLHPAVAGLLFGMLDLVLAVTAFLVADLVLDLIPRTLGGTWEDAVRLGTQFGLLVVLSVAAMRGYCASALQRPGESAAVWLKAWLGAFFVIGWIAFLTKATNDASRGTVSLAFVVGIAAMLPLRLVALAVYRRGVRTMRLATRRVVVIHDADEGAAVRFRSRLRRNGVDAALTLAYDAGSDRSVVQRTRAALASRDIDAVYLFTPWNDPSRLGGLRAGLRKLPVPVYLFPDDTAADVLSGPSIDVGFAHGYEIQPAPLDLFDRTLKRAFDLGVSGLLLFLLAPLLVGVALAVKGTSPGPVFFRQQRRGYSGRPFEILKFRSMTCADDGPEIRQASRGDGRITPLGRFLRASSIDELPQLINVLRGDMSLVGPRPHAIAHDDYYTGVIEAYADRHHVKPGLTGWAQVNGHRGATPEVADMRARVMHDLWYIDHWSIGLDLRIMVRTALVVLRADNAY